MLLLSSRDNFGSRGRPSAQELCLFVIISVVVLSDYEIFHLLIVRLELRVSGFTLKNNTQTISRITDLLWGKKMPSTNPENKYRCHKREQVLCVVRWQHDVSVLIYQHWGVLKGAGSYGLSLLPQVTFIPFLSLEVTLSPAARPLCCLSRISGFTSSTWLWCERIQTRTD